MRRWADSWLRTHSWGGRRHSVREEVERETEIGEDVFEHGDDLQSEDVLSAIVSDLEDGGLPDLEVHLALLLPLGIVDNGVLRGRCGLLLLLAHFEGGHEGSLRDNEEYVSTRVVTNEERRETYLGVTLQRSTRLLVDVDNDSVGITGKVDSSVDLDLGHLLVDLGLVCIRRKMSADVGKYTLSQRRTFFSGLVFLMKGLSLPEMSVTSLKKLNSRS